jgi:hypothetical protein
MVLATVSLLAYLTLVALALITRGKWVKGKSIVQGIWLIAAILVVVELILILGFDLTFRGIWLDRIFPLVMLISGVALYACFRSNVLASTRWVTGLLFFYPMFAAASFLVDRLFSMLVSAPLLAIMFYPEVHYSDQRWEVRDAFGILAAKSLVFFEKSGLTERQIGSCYDERPTDFVIRTLRVTEYTDSAHVIANDGERSLNLVLF